MKYISIDLSNIKEGFCHQSGNLIHLIRYCHQMGYTLIVPQIQLHGKHNNSKDIISNLSEYIDYDTLEVNNVKYTVLLNDNNINKDDIYYIEKYRYKSSFVSNHPLFEHVIRSKVTFLYTPRIINAAKQISEKLGDFTIIHVRRTDRNRTVIHDINTSPPNILEKIKKYKNKNVYIMSDEKSEFFNELKQDNEYSVFLYSDFEDLVKIKEEDNYILFCIEKELQKYAKTRISTFKSGISHDHLIPVI
jgi:hypothetical protein